MKSLFIHLSLNSHLLFSERTWHSTVLNGVDCDNGRTISSFSPHFTAFTSDILLFFYFRIHLCNVRAVHRRIFSMAFNDILPMHQVQVHSCFQKTLFLPLFIGQSYPPSFCFLWNSSFLSFCILYVRASFWCLCVSFSHLQQLGEKIVKDAADRYRSGGVCIVWLKAPVIPSSNRMIGYKNQ